MLETLIARRQLSITELAKVSNLAAHQLQAVLEVLVRQHLVLIHP